MPRAVAVGEQWRVDAVALMELYDPSGAFGFVADDDEEALSRAIDPQLLRSTTDELRCELVAVRESDGGELAILSITGDVRCRREQLGDVSVLVPLAGRLEGQGPSSASLLLSVEGTLEWNLRSQRLANAAVNAELHLERERSFCLQGLRPADVGESESWSGALNVRVNGEPRSRR